jgi:hypothetical protein
MKETIVIFFILVCTVAGIVFFENRDTAFSENEQKEDVVSGYDLVIPTIAPAMEPGFYKENTFTSTETPSEITTVAGSYVFPLDRFDLSLTEGYIKITPKTNYLFTFDGTDITIEFEGVSAPQ